MLGNCFLVFQGGVAERVENHVLEMMISQCAFKATRVRQLALPTDFWSYSSYYKRLGLKEFYKIPS